MNLTKSERTIAVIAGVVILVFVAMFIQVSRGSKAEPLFTSGSAIDYTMARPEQAYSEYTLEGRELDQTFEGLPNSPNPIQLDKRKKELIAKKAAETKKKEDVKKKQVVQARAQETKVKELLQSQKQNTAEKNRVRGDVKDETRPVNSSNSQNNGQNTVVAATPVAGNPTAVKPKKTYTDWRNLLFAAPTTENLTLFNAAYRKNDVSVTEYQAMAQDLVDQSDVKLKAIGLMALRSAPSLASLSQLVHLQAAELGTYQAYVEQSIVSYLQPQNIQYLNQALATKDKLLVVKSLNLLSANLLKFSQGDLAGLVDPRNRREGEVVNFSMNSYRALLPVLNQLGSSQDQEFSALAQQITALIQTSNNVAQN